VFTDENGIYAFPLLDKGAYKVWAQAVGYETARSGVDLAGKQSRQDLVLKSLKDFSSQLTGEEWMASLPGDGFKDRREKAIFVNNCTACHQAGFPLQNKFDAAGWKTIVEVMSKTGPLGSYQRDRAIFPIIQEYQDELVSFLTRVRGPDSPPLSYKLAPRPEGDAAKVVITEYDISPGEAPDYFSPYNGTEWSWGTPSAYEGRSAHDLAVAPNGDVYFTDQANPDRTLGKIDVKTGKVSGWKLSRMTAESATASAEGDMIQQGKTGESVGTHSLDFDRSGNLWFTNSAEGSVTRFDIKTEKFVRYPRPKELSAVGAYLETDLKGNVWSLHRNGATKFDPKTSKYTEYTSITPGGDHYGLGIDSEGNAWYTQIGKDRLGIVDGKTGKVSEVILSPSSLDLTARDLDVATRLRDAANDISAPPQLKGPRRLGGDPTGDSVWVGEFFGDQIAQIDIHTKKITEYPAPRPYMQPYAVAVDKNHMVWITTLNTDRILRFNPRTKHYTEFLLPTRGTEIRFIAVDNRTTPPTVWVPYWRANKIAKLEFPEAPKATRASR
jgi:streptogramin lyase